MADAGFFKGTSADQDRRFSDKELKLLKSMKFPPEFDKKVDMRKVNLQVIRPWVTKKVIELVGIEDELVIEYAMGLLEDDSQPVRAIVSCRTVSMTLNNLVVRPLIPERCKSTSPAS